MTSNSLSAPATPQTTCAPRRVAARAVARVGCTYTPGRAVPQGAVPQDVQPLSWPSRPHLPSPMDRQGGASRRQGRGVVARVRPEGPAGEPAREEAPVEDDKGILHNVTKALRDFGFGRTSLWEGGVGLFLLAGLGVLFVLYTWIRGSVLGSARAGYQAVMEFPQACGIIVGTPVRIRGVPVGSVMSVRPSLEKVDVLVEIRDSSTVIPVNSTIEANQSGLIAEPLVDVTPQLPIPDYKAGPLDPDCAKEGKILCSQGRIQGQPGVSMDDMIFIATKLARQMDAQGTDTMFDAARQATVLMEEMRPLLDNAVKLSAEVLPIIQEVRRGNLVGNLEVLTSTANDAAGDIQRLQHEVLTPENVAALRNSVLTLTKTLEHIEGISGGIDEISSKTGVQKNIRQIIEAFSRILDD
eukprot:jgi/Tetstr1/458858/TSEL_004367.t1